MFQNQNAARVFLYHCISKGNQLSSENLKTKGDEHESPLCEERLGSQARLF